MTNDEIYRMVIFYGNLLKLITFAKKTDALLNYLNKVLRTSIKFGNIFCDAINFEKRF